MGPLSGLPARTHLGIPYAETGCIDGNQHFSTVDLRNRQFVKGEDFGPAKTIDCSGAHFSGTPTGRAVRVAEDFLVRTGMVSPFSAIIRLTRSFVPPPSAVLINQLEGLRWSPGAGPVIWKIARRQRFPQVEDGIDHGPAGFHHIGALE